MRYRHKHDSRTLALICLAACLGVSLGCGSDSTGPSGTAKEGYWALQLDHHTMTLSLTAPTNQLQLHATPITVHGDTLSTSNAVQYLSSDSSVIVDSTGLLTAQRTNAGIMVIARLTVSNDNGQPVTLTDTAMVNVNDPSGPPPVFTAFQFTTPGDSATFSPVSGMTGITVQALDASNTPLSVDNAYNVFCRSSDRDVVDFGRGVFEKNFGNDAVIYGNFTPSSSAYLPGTTMITCSTTIYGVTRTDSLSIRIGMPLYGLITVDTQPVVNPDVSVSQAVVTIAVGGIIQWDNHSKRQVDLVFDDSLAPQSVPASARVVGSGILNQPCGNIPFCHLPTSAGNVLLLPATNQIFRNGVGRDFRRFSVAGTYPYHSVRYPTVTGAIVVQ